MVPHDSLHMGIPDETQGFVVRALLLIGISTFVLTASFVGILGIVTGRTNGVGGRLPYYLIIMGISFVSTILFLEEFGTDSRVIILTATAIGLVTFVATTLTVEGILFSVSVPEEVFGRQLVFYFVAAALVGTGIGYWGIRHWREYTYRTTEGGI